MIKGCKYCGRTGSIVGPQKTLNENRIIDKCVYCNGKGFIIEQSHKKEVNK